MGTRNQAISQIHKSPNSNYLTKIVIYKERERERERFDVIERKRWAKSDKLDKRKLV